jgi:hypothetical protein
MPTKVENYEVWGMNMIIMKEAATLERTSANEGVQLQSLTLSEGTIRFEPDVTDYNVTVAEDVTRILVKGVTSDEDSFYTVSGNTNMVKGKNEIVVTVTDKDGKTGNYYIHVQVGEQVEQESASQASSQSSQNSQGSAQAGPQELLSKLPGEFQVFAQTVTSGNLQYVTYGVLGCGVLAVVLWIAVFARRAAAKRRYKKEKKARLAHRKEQEKQWELAQIQQDILLKQVDELLEKKKTRGPKVREEEPEDFDYEDEGYTEDDDDYDEEQEAEMDRWLAGLDEDGQDEDR